MASIVEKFEQIPVKQRALALGIFMILIAGCFYYFLYMPKAAKIKVESKRLNTLTSEVQVLQTIEAKNKEYKRMIADLTAQLDQARQQLPGEREIPVLLEQIARFGKEAGIEFLSFRPGGESKKDFYNEVPMALSISGPFHKIGAFLDKISHYPRIISVKNITMGSPKEKDGDLMLTSNCTAMTYRYVQAK